MNLPHVMTSSSEGPMATTASDFGSTLEWCAKAETDGSFASASGAGLVDLVPPSIMNRVPTKES